jgi:hypothetical protein
MGETTMVKRLLVRFMVFTVLFVSLLVVARSVGML